jgi:N-acetyl-1-D-myo-inositol-2-amino-2-deoxy-alpha-D-glucopyranoside deacetylase
VRRGSHSPRGRSLLAIFAHPDDESLAAGGLLAACADAGVRVTLVCATRGEAGPNAGTGDGLATVRTDELNAAASVLGVTEVVLLGYRDGYLQSEDGAALEADIDATLQRMQPDVVVTFGEDGLYWHPDHIAVHDRTTAAVATLGPRAPALYYVTMPPGQMRAVMDAAIAAAVNQGPGTPVPHGILGIVDVDAFGACASPPTLEVDVRAFAARKLAALRCHQTQMRGDALDLLPPGDAPRLLGVEHYRRARVGAEGATFVEQFGRLH